MASMNERTFGKNDNNYIVINDNGNSDVNILEVSSLNNVDITEKTTLFNPNLYIYQIRNQYTLTPVKLENGNYYQKLIPKIDNSKNSKIKVEKIYENDDFIGFNLIHNQEKIYCDYGLIKNQDLLTAKTY